MKAWKLIALLLAFALLPVVSGCALPERLAGDGQREPPAEELGPEPEPEYPVTAAGVTLESRPGLVVSLAPSITEKLYDLHMEDRLVGVSKYCDYPPEAALLPRCGDPMMPELEAIAELQPHLLLTEGALAQEYAEALEEMGVAVVVFRHAETLEELYKIYRDIATLLEGARSGVDIGMGFTDGFAERIAALEAKYRGNGGEEKHALYLRMLDFTVATGDTLEDRLMQKIGLINAARDQLGWSYPMESAGSEDLAAFEGIEVLFLDRDYVTMPMLEQHIFYRSLSCVINDQYLYIDMDAFERQSLRMLDELGRMLDYTHFGVGGGAQQEQADGSDTQEAGAEQAA